MRGLTLGGRSMVASAMALPLTLLMIGTGGSLIFDATVAFNQLGFWRWIGVTLGLLELGLGVAVWLPYLHRLVGAVIAALAVMHLALDARAQRPGWALMYAIVFVLAAAIAVLWKTRVWTAEPRPTQRQAHA